MGKKLTLDLKYTYTRKYIYMTLIIDLGYKIDPSNQNLIL